MTNDELLVREISHKRGSIQSDLETRKVHPTYGVTKEKLRRELAELRGMLYALGIIRTGESAAGNMHPVEQAQAYELGIDLDGLALQIRNS